MKKTDWLTLALVMLLTACASTSPAGSQILTPEIPTEEPGYFLEEWTKALRDFKEELEGSSSDVKN